MKQRIKYFAFMLFFAFSLPGGKANAGITAVTLLDSLDLSGFNAQQRTMIQAEVKAYTEPLDELAKKDMAEWKKKVKELLMKIRDGFRVYKLARDPKIEELIRNYDSTANAKVYILTYVEDAFLNNLFLRLAEAFYETARPNRYVIFKYRHRKSAGYTVENPLFDPAKPEIVLAKPIEEKLTKVLSELTTLAYEPIESTNQDISSDAYRGMLFESLEAGLGWLLGAEKRELNSIVTLQGAHTYMKDDVFNKETANADAGDVYLTRSCQYIKFTVPVTETVFDGEYYLKGFTYDNKKYRYSFSPKVKTTGNTKVIAEFEPQSTTRFLPFEHIDKLFEQEGSVKGVVREVYDDKNSSYQFSDESWYFSGFTTQSCSSVKGFQSKQRAVKFEQEGDCGKYVAMCKTPGQSDLLASADFSKDFVDITPNASRPGSAFTPDEAREIADFIQNLNNDSRTKIKVQFIASMEKDPMASEIDKKIQEAASGDKIQVKCEYNGEGLITAITLSGITSYPGGCFDLVAAKTKSDLEHLNVILKKDLVFKVQYAIYKAFFHLLYCYTSEENARKISESYGFLFTSGALNALIQEVDIVGAVEGLISLGKMGAEQYFESYASWFSDMISLLKGDFSMDNKADLIKKLLPPSVRFNLAIANGITNGVLKLGEYLYKNANNPYVHGAVIVAAATIYLGGKAILNTIKKLKFASKVPTNLPANLEDAVEVIADAEKNGHEITDLGEKTVITDGGKEISSISKSEDGTELVVNKVDEIEEIAGTITKKGNKVEYTNPAGKVLTWSEQAANDISSSITYKLNLPAKAENMGAIIEGKVGQFVQSIKKIEAFGQKINPSITDLDVSTADEIIEVKASFSSVKEEQFSKLLNPELDNFCNPLRKKVILYIDKPLSEATKAQENMINRIKSQRGPNGESVTVVFSLEELREVLK